MRQVFRKACAALQTSRLRWCKPCRCQPHLRSSDGSTDLSARPLFVVHDAGQSWSRRRRARRMQKLRHLRRRERPLDQVCGVAACLSRCASPPPLLCSGLVGGRLGLGAFRRHCGWCKCQRPHQRHRHTLRSLHLAHHDRFCRVCLGRFGWVKDAHDPTASSVCRSCGAPLDVDLFQSNPSDNQPRDGQTSRLDGGAESAAAAPNLAGESGTGAEYETKVRFVCPVCAALHASSSRCRATVTCTVPRTSLV